MNTEGAGQCVHPGNLMRILFDLYFVNIYINILGLSCFAYISESLQLKLLMYD